MYYTSRILHSDILSIEVLEKKEIRGKQGTGASLKMIYTLFLIAFTIVNKILLNRNHIFDGMLITLLLYIVTIGLTAYLNTTAYGLSHPGVMKFVAVLRNSAKLSMYLASLTYYAEAFAIFFLAAHPEVTHLTFDLFLKRIQEFIYTDFIKGVMFLFTMAMTIWLLLFFLIYEYKYLIPPFNIITFILFLKKTPLLFEEYRTYSKDKILVIYRKGRGTDYEIFDRKRKVIFLFTVILSTIFIALLIKLILPDLEIPAWVQYYLNLLKN